MGRVPRKRWRRIALALLAGCVVSAFTAEGLVLLTMGEQPKFPRHVVESDFGLRINEPNARYRHKSADVNVRFRINSRGLRADQEYSYDKPPGVRRIVSLGDSFTIGYEVEVEETFSAVLEAHLRADGRRVEVLNAGVSGYSNAEACLYLERELFRYDPDVVLLSFYGNDLVDNVRTQLFGLEDARLVERNETYVPLGGLGNFLNTNWFFNLLSERSNAFVFAKREVTLLLKRRMVARNLANVESHSNQSSSEQQYERELAAAILDRMYYWCRERDIPLVISSIPYYQADPAALFEMFPTAEFDTRRKGVSFLAGTEVLSPFLGQEQLYWMRSNRHWTPFAHRKIGEALAELIDERGLLGEAQDD